MATYFIEERMKTTATRTRTTTITITEIVEKKMLKPKPSETNAYTQSTDIYSC